MKQSMLYLSSGQGNVLRSQTLLGSVHDPGRVEVKCKGEESNIEPFIQQTCLVTALLLCLQPATLAHGFINQAQNEVNQLEPGKPVERQIAGQQEHAYRIALEAGQFLRVLVEQKGINVVLVLSSPEGKPAVEVNFTGAAGPESLSNEAATSGDWRLIVRATGTAALSGSYQVRIEVRAIATEQDKKRIVAERLTYEAYELTGKGQGAAQQSLEKSERALALWRQLGDPIWEAYTLRLIATGHRLLNRYENSIAYFDQALLVARAAKDRYEEASALHASAMPYGLMGRHEKSAESAEQALRMWRELNSKSGETNALNNLAIAYTYLGRYEKAIEYGEQALALLREAKNPSGMGYALNTLGGAYRNLGRYEKAIEYYEQALTIWREVKSQEGEGAALGNIGRAYHSMGQYDKAIEFQEQALAISRQAKDRPVEGRTLNNLGDANRSSGRYEKAIEYYDQALAIYRELKMRLDEGGALGNLGNTYNSMGRSEKAIEYLTQGLAITRETKGRDDEAFILYVMAKAERERGQLTRARTLIEEALLVDESLRANIYSQELRASYFASSRSYHEFYIDLFMRLHKNNPSQGFDALAVEASERARARGLLELLTETSANIREGVDATLIERERTVARQLNAKAASQVQLHSQPHTPAEAAALKQEISQLENDYQQAQAAIRRSSPHYAALTQPQPLGLKEIQRQVLDPETMLLEYSLGEARSYLWAITNTSLTSYELPGEAQVKAAVTQVLNQLTARGIVLKGETPLQKQKRVSQAEEQLPTSAKELSRMLLGPVAEQLGRKRVVVVADGALQYLPFALLPSPKSGSEAESETPTRRPDGRVAAPVARADRFEPLMVGHEIISLPSASMLALHRRELAGRKPAPNLLAVLADPVFSTTDERIESIGLKASAPEARFQGPPPAANTETTRIIEHLSEESAVGTTRTLRIPRLPYTRREADQIIAVAAGSTNLKATDFKANRATVTSGELSQYRYVHFATHGVLDSERPGLSALVLSMVDEQGKPQDGFLRANDIYNLKLPAELVVLSACQTGLGKEIKGEGLVGLTRGFMYAGAARVVVSLWSVNDKATSDLMTKFYEKMLKQGERPAAALRAAQIEMWKQKQWQSPYYWAAFVLQGEWK